MAVAGSVARCVWRLGGNSRRALRVHDCFCATAGVADAKAQIAAVDSNMTDKRFMFLAPVFNPQIALRFGLTVEPDERSLS